MDTFPASGYGIVVLDEHPQELFRFFRRMCGLPKLRPFISNLVFNATGHFWTWTMSIRSYVGDIIQTQRMRLRQRWNDLSGFFRRPGRKWKRREPRLVVCAEINEGAE